MRLLERVPLTSGNAGELEQTIHRVFSGHKLSLRMTLESKNLDYVSHGLTLLEATVPSYTPYQFLVHLAGDISDIVIARFDASPTYEWLGTQTLRMQFRGKDTAIITVAGKV